MRDVTVRALEPGDWPLLERLFGANGACGGCWCMHWRVATGGKAWDAVKGAPNRAAMKRLVGDGAVHAVLALADETPVGWCSFGPKPDFPRLAKSRMARNSAWPDAWAVACFFVARGWRDRGVGRRLLDAAGAVAFARGASVLEGYPVAPKGAGRMPDPFAWTGTIRLFEAAGFRAQAVPDGARPIYLRTPGQPGILTTDGCGTAPIHGEAAGLAVRRGRRRSPGTRRRARPRRRGGLA